MHDPNLRDAATVVLLRRGRFGVETCLLERHGNAGFVPGVDVFPGGVIESDDGDSPAMIGGSDSRSARAVAVRECFEECGLIPALEGAVPPDSRRSVLSGEQSFGEMLAAAGASVDLSVIHPVSRWVTPEGSPRRFDTRFFVAEVDAGSDADVDGVEIVGHRWLTAPDALAAVKRGEIDMIMPTHRTLSRLAAFDSVAAALVGLPLDDPDSPITTVVQNEDGRAVLRVVGEVGADGDRYDPGTAEVLSPGAMG